METAKPKVGLGSRGFLQLLDFRDILHCDEWGAVYTRILHSTGESSLRACMAAARGIQGCMKMEDDLYNARTRTMNTEEATDTTENERGGLRAAGPSGFRGFQVPQGSAC